MLILARKKAEQVLVADAIRITILKVDRGGVRLGIEAPVDVAVARQELLLDAEESTAKSASERSE